MVPTNEDSVTEKRKAEEPIVLEGNKKKKKQVATPRPACSWVHFSREFIKEYSASHPESAGLKAATKAASDAWKSMSVEEKAKYTRRAREVWDNYLSTAPARVPKPRKQAKLITRCSPGRLFNVLQRLTPDQKASVKSMGFGTLLGLRCRTLRRSLCLWLLERFNTTRSSMNICGERIPLSPQDVELVLGLAASGKDVVNSGPDDLIAELRQSYNATNHGISLRLLEDRLAAPEAGDDFKRSFVLYALGTLLCPTARLDVSPSFLHFLADMDVIHQYNWGKFLLDRLIREVSRFRQGKQRAVGGCLLFLQLFYYERISVGGPCELVPTVVPCLSSWGEEEITEREKREKELGGYGRGEVIYKERFQSKELVEVDAAQPDGMAVGEVGTIVEHGLGFDDEGILEIEEDNCSHSCGVKQERGMYLSLSASSIMLRRFCCFNATRCSSAKKQLVFLGSPQVSASVLDDLLNASSAPDSLFEVAAIVTQPPSGRDRGRKVMPSPVAHHALDRGFPSDLIFAPERAGEETFLSNLRALQPELCITAAYGNILPNKFLKIPPLGTVNIHPSLLPLYRGAAPVQRALQDGVKETGVSLAFTVRALDAGPIIACERMEVDDRIKAPDLLALLFSRGSKILIRELPSILDGSARVKAQTQDDSQASLAPKIDPEEAWLSFDQEAEVLHNKDGQGPELE